MIRIRIGIRVRVKVRVRVRVRVRNKITAGGGGCGLVWFRTTALIILRNGTKRNGTESVVAIFHGTERNTANMANIHKSNLML